MVVGLPGICLQPRSFLSHPEMCAVISVICFGKSLRHSSVTWIQTSVTLNDALQPSCYTRRRTYLTSLFPPVPSYHIISLILLEHVLCLPTSLHLYATNPIRIQAIIIWDQTFLQKKLIWSFQMLPSYLFILQIEQYFHNIVVITWWFKLLI